MLALDVQEHLFRCGRYTPPHERPWAAPLAVTTVAGEAGRTPSDEALAERVGRHDVAALDVLYERHGRALFSLAVKLLDDHHAAEEVVQETFLTLWQRPETYAPERGRLLPWLLGVTHHRAVDRLRRRRLERRHSTEPAVFDAPAGRSDPFDEVFIGVRGEAVARALGTLPEAQRRAVELAFLRGLTHVEIAERLGEPLGTVKVRLRLAMQKLRVLPELAELRPDAR